MFSGLAWAVSPKTITSSQAFTDVNNNVLANGTIVFKLANSDLIVGGPQIVQGLTYTITLNSSGLVPAATTIWATDQMTSTGNYYIVNIFNSNGLLVRGSENWRIAGVSPIDLALETNSTLPDPGLSNPVLQNPVAAQTITGQSLTLTSSAQLIVQNAASFTGNPTFTGLPTFQNASSSQTVTLTPLTAAGSTSTTVCATSWTCTPDYGQVTLAVSGSGIASGDQFSVTWSTAGDHIRVCTLNVYDATAAATVTTGIQDTSASTNTTTKVVFFVSSALTTAHTYAFMYNCH